MSESVCPLCGSTQAKALFEAREFILHRRYYTQRSCRSCSHRFIDPIPEPKALEDFYAEVVPRLRALYPLSAIGAEAAALVEESPVEREKISLLRRLGMLEPEGSVLDLGFGSGGFLLAMYRLGWRACGVEFTERVSLPFHPDGRFEVRFGRDALLTLEPGRFNLVTLWHVLEHLPDPVAHLREVRRLMRDDARIVVAVPNAAGLSAKLFGPYWYATSPPWHLHHFTPRSLSRVFIEAGFGVERIEAFGETAMRLLWTNSFGELIDMIPHRAYRLALVYALRVARKLASLSMPMILRAECSLGRPGAVVAVGSRNSLVDNQQFDRV